MPLYHNAKDNITETPLTLSGKVLTPLFKPMGIERQLACYTGTLTGFCKRGNHRYFEGLNLSENFDTHAEEEEEFSIADSFIEAISEFKRVLLERSISFSILLNWKK